MPADERRSTLVATLIPAWVLALALVLTGCDTGSDDPVSPPSGLETVQTLIVEDAQHPIWVSDSAFLFTPADGQSIQVSDLDGVATTIYDGAHNFDYVVSPDGQRVAFSTPDLDGGVYVANVLSSPLDLTLLYPNGRQLSWRNNSVVLLENGLGEFGTVPLASPGSFSSLGEGSYPRADGSGSKIAFLFRGTSSGLTLRFLDTSSGTVNQLVSDMGVDFVWPAVTSSIYGSRVTNGTLSDIVRVSTTSGSGQYETVLAGATRPSISRDGNHLFADRLANGIASGIYYRNLSTDREEFILGVSHPAAAPNGTRCLAESGGDVLLVEFD